MKVPRTTRGSAPPNPVQRLREALGQDWPADIYRIDVLSGRTREFRFKGAPRWRTIQIVHSLLGIELKLGRQRIIVPDLATARYLAIFARLRLRQIAIPYDITRVSKIADRLEGAVQHLQLLIDHLTRSASLNSARSLRRRVLTEVRSDLIALGNGRPDPQTPLEKPPAR